MAGGTWDERTRARSLTGSSWSLLGESGRVVGVFGFAAALVPYLTSLGEVSFYQVWRELIWLAQVGLKNPENTSNELDLAAHSNKLPVLIFDLTKSKCLCFVTRNVSVQI